jgi:hypothetical protein
LGGGNQKDCGLRSAQAKSQNFTKKQLKKKGWEVAQVYNMPALEA